MKKRKIVFASVLVLILAAVALLGDFHGYRADTRSLTDRGNDLMFSLVSFDGEGESTAFVASLGHVWVVLENLTDHTVYLMDKAIRPQEQLTVSAWAVKGHWGVIYNLEAQFARQFGRYDGRRSISVRLPESALGTVESYIRENDVWRFDRNCSYWSAHLWNTVVGESNRIHTPLLLYTPKRLTDAMEEFSAAETDCDLSRAGTPFYDQNGVREELVLCR